MARSCGKQATTMDWDAKQDETKQPIYEDSQTTTNNILHLRALRAPITTACYCYVSSSNRDGGSPASVLILSSVNGNGGGLASDLSVSSLIVVSPSGSASAPQPHCTHLVTHPQASALTSTYIHLLSSNLFQSQPWMPTTRKLWILPSLKSISVSLDYMISDIRKTKKLLNWYLAHLLLNKYK
jgi:hypothetical protein